jgi:hypothetical protein
MDITNMPRPPIGGTEADAPQRLIHDRDRPTTWILQVRRTAWEMKLRDANRAG